MNTRLLGAGAVFFGLLLAGGIAIYFLLLSDGQTVNLPAAQTGPPPAVAAAPAPAAPLIPAPVVDPNDPIARDLASGDATVRGNAIDQIKALDQSDQHGLGVGVPKWGPIILSTGDFEDVEELAQLVVTRRAFDPMTWEPSQRLRAVAFIAQANAQSTPDGKKQYLMQALGEAKGYYNAAFLSHTADAANLLAAVLAQTADAATAKAFLAQQAAAGVSGPTSQPSDILRAIQCDSTHYQFAVDYLRGRYGAHGGSNPSLISQGDYFLVMDRTNEARDSFEQACRAAGSKTRQVRDAVEGVARAMRAQDGNVAHANAFIQSLRDNPDVAGVNLCGPGKTSPRPSDLQTAARAIKLADMGRLDTEPQALK